MRRFVTAAAASAMLACGARSPLGTGGGAGQGDAGADGDPGFRVRDAGGRATDAALVVEDGGVVVLDPVACGARPSACSAQPQELEIQRGLGGLAAACGPWNCYLQIDFDAEGCATRFVVYQADDGWGRDKPPPIATCIAAELSARRWDCAPGRRVVSAGNCGSM